MSDAIKAMALIKKAMEDGAELTLKELGVVADHYHLTRESRLEADRKAGLLKTAESLAEAVLIDQMRKQEATSVGGKLLKVSIPAEPDYKPTVKDWPKLYAHIIKTKDFSFLQKRVGEAAVKERWEAGVVVPGVERFPVYKLSRSEIK